MLKIQKLIQPLLLPLIVRETPHPLEEAPFGHGAQIEVISKEFEEGHGEVLVRFYDGGGGGLGGWIQVLVMWVWG